MTAIGTEKKPLASGVEYVMVAKPAAGPQRAQRARQDGGPVREVDEADSADHRVVSASLDVQRLPVQFTHRDVVEPRPLGLALRVGEDRGGIHRRSSLRPVDEQVLD
jgi:hypothetical protein